MKNVRRFSEQGGFQLLGIGTPAFLNFSNPGKKTVRWNSKVATGSKIVIYHPASQNRNPHRRSCFVCVY
jgi:hypothetical protein